jgi:hypothetical protein
MNAVAAQPRSTDDGRVALTPQQYRRAAAAKYGPAKRLPKRDTVAAAVAAQQLAPRRGTPALHAPASTTQQVGAAPNGFGKYIGWAAGDEQLALVIFLNAGDPTGVAIQGVKATDRIQFVAAAGSASFAEETKNKGVAAAIGVVAAGAQVTAAAFGAPQAAPVIGAARTFAQQQFQAKQLKTKVRDPYGEDPKSHQKARQEGGVLVCSPTAHGVLYSGADGRFWIKEPGNRIDTHRPDHIKHYNSFFLRRGMRPQTFADAGDIYLIPWDFDFTDNFGFYELHVILKRGSGRVPAEPAPVEVE